MPTRYDGDSLAGWREVGESGDSEDRAHGFLEQRSFVKVYGQVIRDNDESVVGNANEEEVRVIGRLHVLCELSGPPSKPRNVEIALGCREDAVDFRSPVVQVRLGRGNGSFHPWQSNFDVRKSGLDSCVRVEARRLTKKGERNRRVKPDGFEVQFRVSRLEEDKRSAPLPETRPRYDVAISYSSFQELALHVRKRLLAYGWHVFAYDTTDDGAGRPLDDELADLFSDRSRAKLFLLTQEDLERRYPKIELEAALEWWQHEKRNVCVAPLQEEPLPGLPPDLKTLRLSEHPDAKAIALAVHRMLLDDR